MPRTAGILLLLALGLFTKLASAGGPRVSAQAATPAAECPASGAAERETIARRWFEDVLNEGDLAVLDEILSPEFT